MLEVGDIIFTRFNGGGFCQRVFDNKSYIKWINLRNAEILAKGFTIQDIEYCTKKLGMKIYKKKEG